MKNSAVFFLFLFSLAAHAQQWELVTPIKTRSQFHAMQMLDEHVAYAVDKPMGAILRTTNGGTTWDRRMVSYLNDPMAIHMWDADNGVAVGESGLVMRTTDGFATVESSTTPANGHYRSIFFLNDTLGWIGSESGRILRSTDGGATWALMESGLPSSNYITHIQFLDPLVGYASCLGAKVIKSTDGGLTWQPAGPQMQMVVYGMHFFDAETGVGVGSAGKVARTTDGGATWDSIPTPSTYTMLGMAAQGDVLVACGNNGRVMRSTDAGLTWTVQQYINTENRSVALSPGGHGILGSDGRIQTSSDMGASWVLAREGTWHTVLNKISFMDADTGAAIGYLTTGGLENGMVRTTDGGRTWKKAGGGGLGVHLTPTGAGCLGGGSGSFARTTDGFATRLPANGPNVAIRCTWSFDEQTHLVGGGAVWGGIYRTTNAGATWIQVLDVGNITISDLWFVNDLQGYAVGEYGDDFRTMDGGLTWQEMTATSGGHTVFFLNEDLGWTGAFRTTDGGDTWTYMGGTPQNTRSIFFTDPDTGYAVSFSGQTLQSTDGGENWTTILPAIFNAQIMDAAWVDGAIVAVGRFGDIYRAQVACPVFPLVPQVNVEGNTLCAQGAGSFQWYHDGEPLSVDAACIQADAPGTYTVEITDALGCVSAPSAPVQVNTTGMAPSATTHTTHLLPNPASGRVLVERPEGAPARLTLLDAQGRVVLEQNIQDRHTMLDISGLRPGIHLVRLTAPNKVETLRLVVE